MVLPYREEEGKAERDNVLQNHADHTFLNWDSNPTPKLFYNDRLNPPNLYLTCIKSCEINKPKIAFSFSLFGRDWY